VDGLIRNRAAALRRRATEALSTYVGDTDRLRQTIDLAVRIKDEVRARRK
jgi:hypothetical protein